MSDTFVKVLPYRVDLDKPIKKTYIDTTLATQDNKAHRFNIALFRDNAQLALPSVTAVSGFFIRYSDNATIPLDGTAEDNTVSVKLKKSCYNKPGQFAVIIKATDGDVINTVFYGEGTILASSTDTIVDDENVIPSLSDLLAQIAVLESVTNAANTAASNANNAAARVSGLTVSATSSSVAGATVSEKDGVFHIAFTLPKGEPGPKGNDGTMSFEDLTDEQRESLRGPEGKQGQQGPKGDTPERGVDYWTATDIAEIISYVDDAILNGAW